MKNTRQTISQNEAAATLESLDLVKRDAIESFPVPLLLITLASLSYGLIVFSWGMTEHENMWALGMYVGVASLLICMAFYYYTFRLLGIKLRIFPSTKQSLRFDLVQLVIFSVITISSRQVRLAGFEFAPHVAALVAAGYLAYLLRRYPTGEYNTTKISND